MWGIVFTFIIIGGVLFLKQFGQDLFEKTKYYKEKRKKGDELWKWATTPPYFTFKKILYWVFITIILTITIYLGWTLETMT